jgi:hypothetical protein
MPRGQTAFASDELIARVECLSLVDGDAYPGILSVSKRRLSFLPIVRDTASAVEPWVIPLRDVQELELGAMEGTLTIRTKERERSVMGTELKGLLESIETALQNQTGLDSALAEDEQVVIEGPMDLYINNLLATRGHLQVTPERVIFVPGRSLESMIWGNLGLDLVIRDLDDVQLTGMRRRVVLHKGDDQHAFRGAIAPRVFGVIEALLEGGTRALGSTVMATWTASLFTGLLTQPGEIVMTRSRLKFTPAGRLESLMGLNRELDFCLADVTRVDVEGLIDRRLVISVGAEEYAFQLSKPLDKAKEIKELLLGMEGDDDPVVPLHGARRATPEILALLELWTGVLGSVEGEEILLFGPGLHQGRKSMFRRGWIFLTTTRVMFLPAGGPASGERPLLASLPVLSAKGRDDALPGELNLSAGNALLRFVPRGGEGFVDTFFFLWREELDRTDEFHFEKHGFFPGKSKNETTKTDSGSGLTALGFVNRRETYRAQMQGRSSLMVEIRSLLNPSADQMVEARLRDLSLGGCSLVTDKRLPERSEFGVELQVGTEVATINARLVYSLRIGRNRVQWRQGLTFLDMSYSDAQLVRVLVMRLQREELSRRSEFEPRSADEEPS